MPSRKRRVSPDKLYGRAVSFGRHVTKHRAIMEAHIGAPLPRQMHVHHINHDKRDNRLENLAVVHASIHGKMHAPQVYPLVKTCERCGASYTPHPTKRKRAKSCSVACGRALTGLKKRKLNEAQRADIRARYAVGERQTALAAEYNVTQSSVWSILQETPLPKP